MNKGLWFASGRLLLCVLASVLVSTVVQAHDARPVTLKLSEVLPGLYQARLTIPPTVSADNKPFVVWPEVCEARVDAQQGIASYPLMACAGGLAGLSMRLEYPQFNPALSTYFSLHYYDGTEINALLTPDKSSWQVPQHSSGWELSAEYLLFGVEHILAGWDHLLFVLGLLVIARSVSRILWAVSGFTVAHSLTLSLAALGYLRLPLEPVEAVIALSIVFLAYEICRQQTDSLTFRKPFLVAFGFGLLHGLGFASVLNEIGVPEQQVWQSLLFFNLGVEAGQVLFILSIMLIATAVFRVLKNKVSKQRLKQVAANTDLAAAYVIGIPATYWLLERVGLFA